MREPSLRRKVFLFSLATFALKASLPSPMDRGDGTGLRGLGGGKGKRRGGKGKKRVWKGEEEGKVG